VLDQSYDDYKRHIADSPCKGKNVGHHAMKGTFAPVLNVSDCITVALISFKVGFGSKVSRFVKAQAPLVDGSVKLIDAYHCVKMQLKV